MGRQSNGVRREPTVTAWAENPTVWAGNLTAWVGVGKEPNCGAKNLIVRAVPKQGDTTCVKL